MRQYFEDRLEAGRELGGKLSNYRGTPDLLVLGLPRGGVPVAAEVARRLGAELDVLVVRKVAQPFHPELALAAIATGGARALNPEVIAHTGTTPGQLAELIAREARELSRRERAYRGDRPPPRIAGRTVILVDDGIATGATMQAAVQAVRSLGPARVVVAVPVSPSGTAAAFHPAADDFVSILSPTEFEAVGWWYRQFPQLSDDEVLAALRSASG